MNECVPTFAETVLGFFFSPVTSKTDCEFPQSKDFLPSFK